VERPAPRRTPGVAALVEKGRRFSEEDKHALLDLQQEFLDGILPRWRAVAETGQVEFSVSAYYHPILPLLCGLDSALEALPQLRLPGTPFAHPEDARLQLEAAFLRFEQVFGKKPAGGWPPEGAISATSLQLMAEAGYRWTASDEDVLFGSLGERMPAERAAAEIKRDTLLYRPWRHANPVPLFRDHSCRTASFRHSAWHPQVAAEDLIRRLLRARRSRRTRRPTPCRRDLDGENAWEYYP
jgi:alpha-amylase/alpha-mannosidase (GH57 family)